MELLGTIKLREGSGNGGGRMITAVNTDPERRSR
jgi:hypothetical protein